MNKMMKKTKMPKEPKEKKLSLFNKNKISKNTESDFDELQDEVLELEKNETLNVDGGLKKGMITTRDLIAPPSFYRGEVAEGDWLKVGSTFTRPFVMQGFPSVVDVGWLDELYSYQGDMDVALHIQPADDREALDELTNKLVQFESQYAIEAEKGSIKNLTKLRADIDNLYAQRAKIERNQENLFYIQISANLYANSKEELDKQTQKIDNKLKGRKIYLMPTFLQQDEGYKSSLPLGKSYLPDKFRNFNSGALTSTFPFYNSEIMHESGIFCAQNRTTGTPILIDFYDRDKLTNGNITVFGKSGMGKTFFVSLLTMRSALRGVRTAIVDPEGEFKPLTEALGGSHVYIATDSDQFINPFDIESEESIGKNGEIVNKVDVKSKVADLLNLIGVMNGGLSNEERSLVSVALRSVYDKKGITEDATSLKVIEPFYDEASGVFYHQGIEKPMPTFSDFHEELEDMALKERNADLKRLAGSLEMFKKGGIYDLFDIQTSPELKNYMNTPIVTFDVSRLEESILRPIGMYIALQWIWEKFVKKNPTVKKRIVCDEAWMLVNKNMAGNEMTAQFLETTSRRIRKRNGGLLIASQNFLEFDNSEQGKAVLSNSVVNFFLGQDQTDITALQDRFKLSDGEVNFLLRAKRGETLIRIQQESAVGQIVAFPYEQALIDKAKGFIGGETKH